ncbi:probable protein phosphatase 2C 75 [Syzygium oleosum]|uniref:probable protein phosphatase 2C 75 n=1 Tax=Syzygium oleosum TaxID=219896 RepID=UPI0024B94973|nr:probable protein phosphatase 2C 75 [Syzygium oleosum]XP_056159060.1 probable protein phosphatase 2C 75 [Syzygium oleosum]
MPREAPPEDRDAAALHRLGRRAVAAARSLPGGRPRRGSSPRASGAKRIRASDGSCCLLPSSSSASSGDDAEAPPPPPPQPAAVVAATTSVECYGAVSVCGRSREMEDAISVWTGLCRPELSRWRPVHFFAVFDGHGGHHVSRLCREKMHVFLEEELTRAGGQQQADEDDAWREVMRTSFRRMDEVAMNTCACGSVGSRCGCHPMELALGGSTAVAAVLTPDRIVVANCGDSRAVLCRGGKVVPLSRDHKPDRPDELARIEAAGGRVIYENGARVEGILAMSRAIGDKYLKPVVTSEPEITFTARQAEDDCLILASDGLWDVLSSELACEVAFECLREGSPPAMDLNSGPAAEDDGNRALFPSRSVLAASLLTRLALGRKSWDNISVIVVDLKKS